MLFPPRGVAALLIIGSVASAGYGPDPAEAILDGVHSIATVGSPGVVAVFGEDAFALVVGKSHGDVRAPVVAAAPYGSGRIVAFAHTGYFGKETMSKADGPRFFCNCVRWAADKPKGPVRVLVVGRNFEFVNFVTAQGFEARAANSLRGFAASDTDVLIRSDGDHDDAEDLEAVVAFVQKGGGMLVATTPWGWLQLNPGRSLATDHPGNALLVKAGLAWVDGTVDETSPHAFTVGQVPKLVHASRALDLVLQQESAAHWTRAESAQARWSILAPLPVLPRNDKSMRPRLARLRSRASSAYPTAKVPFEEDATLARLSLALGLEDLFATPAQEMRAHPASESFPGSVPKDAPRVARTIDVDTHVPDWHSTGLYAAAGEVISVERTRGPESDGLFVQIGAHTDDISNNAKWSRCPRVVVKAPMVDAITHVASPFGGLVYIVVPHGRERATVTLRVTNAVEAPRFVAGETDLAQWNAKLRALPAPWAELETRKVILTLPSQVVRDLDDPGALLSFWDRVLDACANLAQIPHDRPRPERYVTDQQISAGYMHSGYPIMTHLDVAPTFVDLARLTADKDGCGWGFYHEMGHNHQRAEWTFEGTGEVTNNLFAVYVLDTVVKAADARTAPAACQRRFDEYRRAGAKYEQWKQDPFLALGFFLEIERAFGWKPFQALFAEEAALPPAERPKRDEDKRTQWLVRLSHGTGRDLSPWFALWNIPVDQDAARCVSDLPPWIADGYASK